MSEPTTRRRRPAEWPAILTTADPAELLSAEQVAGLLHIREQEVRDLIADGTIPSVLLGRHRRVLRATLIDWIKSREDGVSVSSGVSSLRPPRAAWGADRARV